MKTLRLFAMLCTTMLLCNSCLKGIGWEEEQRENQNPDEPQTGLVLTATPSTIIANGEDCAVLEVQLNGETLTEGFSLYDGDDNPVELENMEFRTETVGEYLFWAEYKSEISQTITITATEEPENPSDPNIPDSPTDSDPENLNFKRRSLLIQFTGTGCGYCPGMTQSLRDVLSNEEYAEHTVLTAAHRFNNSDPAYLAGYALDQAMGISDYPSLVADMCYIVKSYTTNYVENLVTTALSRTTAKAGIAATAVVEDNQVIVTATVKAAEESLFRIGAWIIEDGIYGLQTNYGVAEGDFNTHDHCIRAADSKVSTRDYTGYAIGPVDDEGNIQPIKKGETAEHTFTIELKDKWNRDKCSLVIFVTTPERVDRNEYYFVNNVIKMPLEGQHAFEYIDNDATSDEE
jgi:hypothetical protein